MLSPAYSFIRQNAITNALFRIGSFSLSSDTAPKGAHLKKLIRDLIISRDNLTLFIPDYEKLLSEEKTKGFRTSTFRLFDASVLWFTNHNNDPQILLPLTDYMELCDVSDKKYLRARVVEDLNMLSAVQISYTSKTNGRKSKDYSGIKIMSSQSIRNGIIKIHLTDTFTEILMRARVMPYPTALFSLRSDKFPNAFYILRRIAEHKYMNAGKLNENTISAKTLLNACPIIPSIETVRQSSNPTPYNRIILPWLRDLKEACYSIGIHDDYKLVYRNIELSYSEIKKLSYEKLYSDLCVQLPGTWPDYPEHEKKQMTKTKRKGV